MRSRTGIPSARRTSLVLFLALLALAIAAPRASANSEIFPPLPPAESAIHWKDGYFIINGQPTFITSGEMHYARIPRELWKDRIWRSKMMGFNCMQMYVFWNASEGREGKWNFEDNLDLDAWLSDVQAAGMYAVVRVGPYSCAEWEHGGFPAWLTSKPEMTLRDSGPQFLKYADAHLAQVEQIVAKHQINHGGNVLMVQLENEHREGWGTEHNDYLQHLYDQARANGLEIPLFFSGLHHGGDPSGQTPYKLGPSPWFTTEFWTGWIGRYGDMDDKVLQEKIAGTWKIIAFGGAGYDYYMVHGGTNFGYSGDSFMTSYDYSAPIGETGQFHNFYAYAKRAALFARSFNELLTGSHDDPTLAKADLNGLRVSTRTNPTQGSFILIDNFQKKVDTSKLPEIPPDANAYQAPAASSDGVLSTRLTINGEVMPHKGSFKVSATDPRMVLINVPLTSGGSLASICANVMTRVPFQGQDLFVVYGQPGDTGEVNVGTGADAKSVDFTYPPGDTVTELPIDAGAGHHALFLVVNTDETKKIWLANGKLYIGPSFVEEDGKVEFPPGGGKGVVYSDAGKSAITSDPITLDPLPALAKWTWRDAAPERATEFDCTGWTSSTGLVPMGRLDGFANRYGWYRTTFTEPADATLNLKFEQRVAKEDVWLNGAPADLSKLSVKAGKNTLAIFVKLNPRPKWFAKDGPIGTEGYQGLWGGISLDADRVAITPEWTASTDAVLADAPETISAPDYNADPAKWTAVPTLQAVKGMNYFRGTFTLQPGDTDAWLEVSGDGGVTCYVNGVPNDSSDPKWKLNAGPNVIYFYGEFRDPKALKVTLTLHRDNALAHNIWLMRGGLNGLEETAVVGRVTNWPAFLSHGNWLEGAPKEAGVPTFWHTTFTYHPRADVHETIGLFKTKDVLSAGHVWLNGHNLGEAPQAQPLYLPECWLKDGANDLVVFDFAGNHPDGVTLDRYEAFAVH
jgi:beta-galactosidase